MSTTSDPTDPRLTRGVDEGVVAQAETYLVLSEEERKKGFVRPLRFSYWHTICGEITSMSNAIADTCRMHRPVGADGEFHWVNAYNLGQRDTTRDPKVGT
jgi:hypothetical protein